MALENLRGRADRVFHPVYTEQRLDRGRGYATRFDSQGTQFRGMGKYLHETDRIVRQIYSIASQELGRDVAAISFGDPTLIDPAFIEDDAKIMLDQTRYTQVALAAYNAACLYRFRKENPNLATIRPSLGVGESWGFMGSAFAAGGFGDITYTDSFRNFAAFNVQRGELFQEVCDIKPSGLVQLEVQNVNQWEFVDEVANDKDLELAFDVDDSIRRYGGDSPDLVSAREILEGAGIKVRPLRVSGKFHSKAFREVGDRLRPILRAFLRDLEYPIVSNVTREVRLIQSKGEVEDEAVRICSEPVYTKDINAFLTNSRLASIYKMGGRRTFGDDVLASPILTDGQKKAAAGGAAAGAITVGAIAWRLKNRR